MNRSRIRKLLKCFGENGMPPQLVSAYLPLAGENSTSHNGRMPYYYNWMVYNGSDLVWNLIRKHIALFVFAIAVDQWCRDPIRTYHIVSTRTNSNLVQTAEMRDTHCSGGDYGPPIVLTSSNRVEIWVATVATYWNNVFIYCEWRKKLKSTKNENVKLRISKFLSTETSRDPVYGFNAV